MKKVFLWLLIISMIAVFSLAGCKSEAAEEVTEEETVEEPVEEPAVEEEVTEVIEEEETVGEAEEGAVPSDEMAEEVGTVTDIDGNVYHTVTIGTQVWMVENLKVTHYRNGYLIPNITDGTQWGSLKTGAYCNYNNDSNNADTYGYLYNWYAVNDSRNICPAGWHVPTDEEWETLETYLGGGTVAGGKMKETGTEHWKSSNTGATNESGFTALPGGYRRFDGIFHYVGGYGYWWSATEHNATYAWYHYVGFSYSNLNRYYYSKELGFSLRCLRD